MSFDNSRNTFDPWKDFAGVVMEQGRVQTDADWNEWLAEQMRRIQAGTLDTMGPAVYPKTTPFAFQIAPSSSGGSVDIGRGRMYVDGIQVENHGHLVKASWDPALAELTGSPQPPPVVDANPVAYEEQPYVLGAAFPTAAGDYLVYLDVWKQPVTFIEDPSLVDAAIGIDTSGRLRTAWRVGTMAMPSGTRCADAAPVWPVSSGQLTNGTVTSGPSGPCCLTAGTGYTGVENQFYRVGIHTAGAAGGTGATFKWSRENASVQTSVTDFGPAKNTAGNPASQLTVVSLGRDQVLGFSAGDWVEITNETSDNLCQPGTLYQIDRVDVATLTITLASTLPAGFSLADDTYTRLIRWDQRGKVYKGDNVTVWCDLDTVGAGGIPVPTDGSQLVLEGGIVVSFGLGVATGSYLAMDYWNFSARTATGTIDTLVKAPPRGVHHHYAQLSIATVDGTGKVTGATDCRIPWDPSGRDECGCCTATAGKGGTFSTISAAIDALPDEGGEICLMPGEFYENVVLSDRRNVVIKGCGWQTHVFSASLAEDASSSSAPASSAQSGLSAVFTIVGCYNIQLRSFSITAAEDEVGILLDRGVAEDSGSEQNGSPTSPKKMMIGNRRGDSNVLIEDMILEAAMLPAIVAVNVSGLKVEENRISMTDVKTRWATVYLSGEDIYFRHNWVGLGWEYSSIAGKNSAWSKGSSVPAAFGGGLKDMKKILAQQKKQKASQQTAQQAKTREQLVMEIMASQKAFGARAPGGIQIAGPSKDVFVIENEIVGGLRNGITLGSFLMLDENGDDTGVLTGVHWEIEGDCTTTGSGDIPGTTGSGPRGSRTGAGGLILNLHISRNRIHQMGMSGIGVVGFWNLHKTPEIISIENLSITENVIARTMQRPMSRLAEGSSSFAYGAISLADVENLMIRDNIIVDFGHTAGDEVCGIFVLHGQMVEISRNQIRETREASPKALTHQASSNGARAGILIYLATPPTVQNSGWTRFESIDTSDGSEPTDSGSWGAPLYEPVLPALRMQENVVRVAIGLALEAFGYGPFTIVNNHFGSGASASIRTKRSIKTEYVPMSQESESVKDPLLIGIINLGLAIEDVSQGDSFMSAYSAKHHTDVGVSRGRANGGNGTVLFTNNICQLEAWSSGVRGLASVAVLTLDHVLFTNNQLWLDAPMLMAFMDACVLGATVQMCDNRLQEGHNLPVLFSAMSVGIANVTAHNIATYCLEILGPSKFRIHNPNVILWPLFCGGRAKEHVTVTGDIYQAKGKVTP